ncbi:MAG: histidine kinase dimerization/phospho-acceptor domain-containing protein, partial [Alphaproteobacteria bacterium]
MSESFIKSLRHRLLPRTLFGRSLMIISLPVLLLQVVVAFMFFDRHWDSMTEKLVSALAGEIEVLSTQIAQTQKPGDVIEQASKNLEMVITIEPLDKAALKPGVAFKNLKYFSIGDKLQAGLERKLTRPFIIQTPKRRWFDIVVKLDHKRMARFQCPERRLASSTTYIFILWVIGSAMVLLGIAMLFMRNQIRPIMRLAVAAEKFGKGQDVPDFRPVGAREVRQASTAFLEMKERLKRQMEQRTAMLSGVSHDLRTPLTRMKLQLAMQKTSTGAENLRQDIEEMEKMIEGYLTFAKGESDEAAEMTDLKTVLERLAGKAKRQGANIQEQLPEGRLM